MSRIQFPKPGPRAFSYSVFSLLQITLVLTTDLCVASRPCVQFDVGRVVQATDVSTADFLATHSGEKLIHVCLPISAFARLDSEGAILQHVYLLSGPATAGFQIVDYAPKTTLASDVAGPISIEHSSGNSSSVGITAKSPKEIPIQADASANRKVSSSDSSRMKKLPPRYLLAASGTLHRGTAAY